MKPEKEIVYRQRVGRRGYTVNRLQEGTVTISTSQTPVGMRKDGSCSSAQTATIAPTCSALISTQEKLNNLLTWTRVPLPRELEFLRASKNPVRDEVYFWHDLKLMAVDLTTRAARTLFNLKPGWCVSMTNCSSDGQFVYFGSWRDLSTRITDRSASRICRFQRDMGSETTESNRSSGG